MLSVYELYDLHIVLVAIRAYPEASINNAVVLKVLEVLNNRVASDENNQFRKSLQGVEDLDKYSIYDFVFTENKYSYYPLPYLKDKNIYAILVSAFEELLVALGENNRERIVDLAECLHNLPIILVDNIYSLPKSFWKHHVKHYRSKWNGEFLIVEQKRLNAGGFLRFS